MMPSRLELDFRRRSRASAAGLSVLVAGIGLLATAVFLQRQADEEVHRLENALAGLFPAQVRNVEAERFPVASTEHMQAVLASLKLPWEKFFTALEAIPPDDVTLLAITPEAKRGTVQLRGEARNLYAVLRYVKAIGSGGYFTDAELLEHEIGTQNPVLPVRFVIAARWEGIGGSW